MLVNFCDTCLRTDVTCSTVSTEGYEVTNLVNNTSNGFLAYSCIKPPVHVDFVFICNVKISHVIVWPQVGAQKSCGFQLSVKSSDNNNEPFTNVSTAFLQKENSGVLFYRRDIPYHTEIDSPPNFMRRYIKAIHLNNYTNAVRLSILKTDNSVPALAKVEIWGNVSPKCPKDLAMNVMSLWMNRFNSNASTSQMTAPTNNEAQNDRQKETPEFNNALEVPEDFLDPITFEIMTQPIILPSGKIIDQKTLEKHGHSEALWGRPVSDPFTGIRFNDNRRPIAAIPLKGRIDKFLLENSNTEEVKKLPRVLGSKGVSIPKSVQIISSVTETILNSDSSPKSSVNNLKRALPNENNTSTVKRPFCGHFLPVASAVSLSRNSKVTEPIVPINRTINEKEIERKNKAIEDKLNLSVQVAKAPSCKCCTNSIFYKLPCEHVICRKALLSLEKNQCGICKLEFKSNDPQRFHL